MYAPRYAKAPRRGYIGLNDFLNSELWLNRFICGQVIGDNVFIHETPDHQYPSMDRVTSKRSNAQREKEMIKQQWIY